LRFILCGEPLLEERKTPMPTYQYRCTECGEDLEAVQKFSDAPLDTCPTCGGRLRKVFNAVGVVFKGSGFYRTDSRNGSANGDGADSRTSEKKSGAETKSADKEPAGSGSARSNASNKDNSNKENSTKDNSTKDRQPVSSGTSSTGQKTTSS
jgi:putative FmdB family regulatory protein